ERSDFRKSPIFRFGDRAAGANRGAARPARSKRPMGAVDWLLGGNLSRHGSRLLRGLDIAAAAAAAAAVSAATAAAAAGIATTTTATAVATMMASMASTAAVAAMMAT